VNGPTRLVLCRHAEPSAAAVGRCYGKLDVALSREGHRQARMLAHALAQIPLAALYSSPSRRALDTAAPIAAGRDLEPVVDQRLSELDFGSFEGRTYEELERDEPDFYRDWMETPTLVQFPGGESYSDLHARSLDALDAIVAEHAGETAVIVSHGGVVRPLLASCLAMPAHAIFRIDQTYAAISVVEWIDAAPIVRLLNAPAAAIAALQRLPAAAARTPGRPE
jgi:broad specificity phosphatase PhoE